jgi:hypothetical protein
MSSNAMWERKSQVKAWIGPRSIGPSAGGSGPVVKVVLPAATYGPSNCMVGPEQLG